MYKLNKALYGLRQAPRAWYSKIDEHFIAQGFSRSISEPTLHKRIGKGSEMLFVCLYVDDIIYMETFGSEGITISQTKYTGDLLHKFGMEGCKYLATPMNANEKLKLTDGIVQVKEML